jgi:hypothetical protein
VLLTTDSDLAGAVINAKSSGLKVLLFSDLDTSFVSLKCCYVGIPFSTYAGRFFTFITARYVGHLLVSFASLVLNFEL